MLMLMLTRLREIIQRTCKFVLEGQLYVARIQRRSLNEGEPVLAGKSFRLCAEPG